MVDVSWPLPCLLPWYCSWGGGHQTPPCPCLDGGSWEGGMGHSGLSGSAMSCVVPNPDPAFEMFLPTVGQCSAHSLIKAFPSYFLPWHHVLSFIFIYSLFLSIPLPYLSQPPHWLLPCFPGPASTHRCHQTGGLGDSPAPGDVSASPALTLPLDTLLFPFFLRWKGFPPSLPLFPHMGGVAESNGAGSWLHHLEEGALSLREKSWTPSSSFLAPSARRGPCCAVLGYLQAGGALWFSATSLGCCWQGFRSGKSAVRRGP